MNCWIKFGLAKQPTVGRQTSSNFFPQFTFSLLQFTLSCNSLVYMIRPNVYENVWGWERLAHSQLFQFNDVIQLKISVEQQLNVIAKYSQHCKYISFVAIYKLQVYKKFGVNLSNIRVYIISTYSKSWTIYHLF